MSRHAKFKLTIELGNDAMSSTSDLAAALVRVSEQILDGYMRGYILDNNGNTVGEYMMHGVFQSMRHA